MIYLWKYKCGCLGKFVQLKVKKIRLAYPVAVSLLNSSRKKGEDHVHRLTIISIGFELQMLLVTVRVSKDTLLLPFEAYGAGVCK